MRAARNSRGPQEHAWRCCLLFSGAAEARVGQAALRPAPGWLSGPGPGQGRRSQALSSIQWGGLVLGAFTLPHPRPPAHYPFSKPPQVLY